MTTKVLLVGASGFLGGTLLDSISQAEYASRYQITALVRSQESADAIKAAYPSTNIIIGAVEDSALVEDLASASQAVIDVAGADNQAAIKAIIAGLKKQKERTGDMPVYVNLSGAACMIDDAKGQYTSEKIWDDANLEDFWALPDTVAHKDIDVLVASAASDIKVVVACPPYFYGGQGKGPIKRPNLFNMLHISIRTALALKQVCYLGKGLAGVSTIHVEDLANFLILLLVLALQDDPKIKYGRDGFYFPTGDSSLHKEIADALAKRLYQRGLIPTLETRPWTEEELQKYVGPYADMLFGSNMRSVGSQSLALGWKPTYAKDGIALLSRESIDAEIDAML